MVSHSAVRVISCALVVVIVLAMTGCRGTSSFTRKLALTNLAALESGCKSYKDQFQVYPPSGAENLAKYLTGKGMPGEAPGGGFRTVKGGRIYGPYVEEGDLRDPWGNPYQYRYPGQHNANGIDLWSYGPDGRDGGGDDICNWEE